MDNAVVDLNLQENESNSKPAKNQEEMLLESLENEEVHLESDDNWRNQDKHVFILSEAGKPIYTL